LEGDAVEFLCAMCVRMCIWDLILDIIHYAACLGCAFMSALFVER